MKTILTLSIAVFFVFITAGIYAQQTTYSSNTVLPAAALKPYGRCFIDSGKDLALIGSAVHFTVSFSGTQCILYASINEGGGHNYLQYELDGVYQKRLKIEGNGVKQIAITTRQDGMHTLTVYKATEATTGNIYIHSIEGNNVLAVEAVQAPLIEFIGNSITCGAAADTSEVKCGQGVYHDQHNAYYAYGPRVARALGINFILSSVSGIGIYRTWNMDSPSMPQVYEKRGLQTSDTAMWNFSRYKPAVVSIALGTNDMSHGDGKHSRLAFDSGIFINKYVAFVRLVKSKYPEAIIALLSSPMMHGQERLLLQRCLSAVKQQVDSLYPTGKPIALHFFKPMTAGGCSGHPSIADHAVIAEELIPFFKDLLK